MCSCINFSLETTNESQSQSSQSSSERGSEDRGAARRDRSPKKAVRQPSPTKNSKRGASPDKQKAC